MDPISLTIKGAKKLLGIGTTKIYELIGDGKLRTVKLGRRTLFRADSIRELIDTLEAA